ncbi:MAG: TRAP transporter large permease [Lachnospiraceae bacterium]|nr:TRAP transporter large permease [Lachnospiraceae bacterium]
MALFTLGIVTLMMLLIGVPIGISISLGLIASSMLFDVTTLKFIAQSMYTGLDSLPVVAVPCFMLAGSIMEAGGLSKRLVNVAEKFVGHSVGGFCSVTVVACLFFGAISGSAPATVAAIGGIMIPYMVKSGYENDFSAGLVAVAGGLGIIVPPSIPFVIYGITTQTNIGDLFIGGFGPALLIAIFLIAVSKFISYKKGYKGSEKKPSLKEKFDAIWDAKWALIMPVIILGGIYGGVFTPTEAAVVATFYGIIIGFFVYKELKFKNLISILDKNTSNVGGFMLSFAPAAALGAVLTMLGVPGMLKDLLLNISTNIYVIMIIVNIFLLFIGMILDTISAIAVFAPILYAILVPMGINPVHLGVIVVVNLAIGFVTPPVAMNLFVASTMTGIPIDRIVRKAAPFIYAMIIALIIITFVPGISLTLGNLLKAA